ncbi:Signal peptide region containing protein [Cryptosporidium tyzzeri]|nr:Signal peptide region containing protein [Cryptosporidium tyzzeri]
MSLLFLTFVLIILKTYCLNSSGNLNEIEFPPSWHFFENHNSLESYKYGFFMKTLLHFKKKSERDGEIFSNIMNYNIESKPCEIDEDVFNLLNNPVILVDNRTTFQKDDNKRNVLFCQEKTNIGSSREKRKTIIRTLKLKLENGNILRLMLSFSKIGLWIWDNNLLSKNHSNIMNRCFAVGKKDKIKILQKSLHSKIKVSELLIEVPFFKSKLFSQNMYNFIVENKIDGIIGLNDNSIQGVGIFETASKAMEPSKGRYIMSFQCSGHGDKNRANQNEDSLIFAVYNGNGGESSKYEKLLSNGESDSIVKVMIDKEVKSKFNVKFSINLNIYGAIIPEIRLLQLYIILNKYAVQKGFSCETRETVLGKTILCDCNFLNNKLSIKLYNNANSYSIDLSNFVINNGNDQKSCGIEIYGRKRNGIKFEENWVFGQILCSASNISRFSKTNRSSWSIGNPKLFINQA